MYIDPNTGGMLFQVLAVVLGLFSGTVLLFSSKIRAAIARIQRSIRPDEPENRVERPENRLEPVGQPNDEERVR